MNVNYYRDAPLSDWLKIRLRSSQFAKERILLGRRLGLMNNNYVA